MKQGAVNFAYLVAILLTVTIAARATNNMILTTAPPFARYGLHMDNTDVGLLEALAFLSTFAASSAISPRMARHQRHAFIAANGAVLLSMYLIYFSGAITIWFLVILAGIASGIVMPSLITAASATVDKRQTERLLSIYTVGLSTGLILGPFAETELLRFMDYRTVFLPFSAFAVAALLLSFRVQFPHAIRGSQSTGSLKFSDLLPSILSNATYAIPFAAITTFLAIYASQRFHVSPEFAYLPFIPFFIVSFATRTGMVFHSGRNLILIYFIASAATVAGLLLLGFAGSFFVFLGACALLGFPHGAIYPLSTILVARSTTLERRHAANSYFAAAGNLINVSVPVATGFLSDAIGMSYSFILLAIPVAAISLIFAAEFSRSEMLR